MPFLPLFTGIRHLAHVLTVPQQKRAYSALHPQAWTYIYDIYTGHACRHLPSAVPWISEDRLFGIRVYGPLTSLVHILIKHMGPGRYLPFSPGYSTVLSIILQCLNIVCQH